MVFSDFNENMSNEQKKKFENFLNNHVEKLIAQQTYNWKPIDFNNKYVCHQYLMSRFAPEYNVIKTIFKEIQQRDPNFAPETLFDFGSGTCTVTMYVFLTIKVILSCFDIKKIFRNAKHFWGASLKEYYCVDTSSTMNDMAKLLLQNGNPNNEEILPKGLFYRQFLPTSPNVYLYINNCNR